MLGVGHLAFIATPQKTYARRPAILWPASKWRIRRGQYKKHPYYLDEFTRLFNELNGSAYSASDILHYMKTQQKATNWLEEPWPTFAGAHRVLPPVASVFTAAHLPALRMIFVPLDLGTDAVAYRDDVLRLLEREFLKLTKLFVPGMLFMLLAATAETGRKHANWICIRDTGFNDLDKIG